MLIKTYIILAACVFSTAVFAQTQQVRYKPMTEREIKNYEYQLNQGLLDPKVPRLKRQEMTKLMEEIYVRFVDIQIPSTAKECADHSKLKIPTSPVILMYANRLKRLIAERELQEVSGYKLSWFKNVGNAMVKLNGYHTKLKDCVIGGNEKKYKEVYHFYRLETAELEKILRNPETLSPREKRIIEAQNTAARKKEYTLLENRYHYTMKLKDDMERKQRNRQGAGR